MKKKSIILPAMAWLVALTSAGALTFASTSQTYQWARQWNMRMRQVWFEWIQWIKDLGETDRQAMMEASKEAMEKKDYQSFKAAHEKYWITLNMTEDQFNEIIEKRNAMESQRAEKQAERGKIQEAIKNWDFETRKELNTDKRILNYIDTEEKFKKLQEIEDYKEKARTIAEELWLPQWEWRWMWMKMWWWKGMWMWYNK